MIATATTPEAETKAAQAIGDFIRVRLLSHGLWAADGGLPFAAQCPICMGRSLQVQQHAKHPGSAAVSCRAGCSGDAIILELELQKHIVAEATLEDRMADEELRKLRARRRALELFDAEKRPPAEPFDLGTVDDILARPAPAGDRVEGLMPWDASTLIVAQRKTGKTTFVLNLARSLLTGEAFLGAFNVIPAEGAVCLLNYEVTGAQVARWAREVGVPGDRLILANLRGRRNPLSHPEDRKALAGQLKAHRVTSLIVDPFGRAYTGANQNDAGEVGAWLSSLDTFTRTEVGALDLVLTTHAGWNAERSRGSSALEDWADSIVTLNRDENTGDRYLRAIGRDVDLEEDRLDFDPDTRRLTLSGAGDRRKASASRKGGAYRRDILDILEANPAGLSGKDLRDLTGHRDASLTSARNDLVADGVVVETHRPGRGGGSLYVLNSNMANMAEGSQPPPSEHGERGPLGGHVRLDTFDHEPGLPPSRTCRICGQPLHATAVAGGFHTCPTCDQVTR